MEALLASKVSGCPWDNETARWVADLPDELADKLPAVGLIPKQSRDNAQRLRAFLDSQIQKRIDVKGDTKVVWGHTKRNPVAFFGKDKHLDEIEAGLAAARARGRRGGRPRIESEQAKVLAAKRLHGGKSITIADICTTLNISRPTYCRYMALQPGDSLEPPC